MPRVSTNVVITHDETYENIHIRRIEKVDKNFNKSESYRFDDRRPMAIIQACDRANLTTKESVKLFLYLATTETNDKQYPYPAWSTEWLQGEP